MSAKNATKHGLYARVETFPFEDPEEKQAHVNSYIHEHKPVGPTETGLVLEIADITWARRWIKISYRAKFYGNLDDKAAIFERSGRGWRGHDDINFREAVMSSHEKIESELDEIMHEHQAATKVMREICRLGRKATVDAMLRVASPRFKKEWEERLKRSKRELKPEELPDELWEFIVLKFLPRITKRTDTYSCKKAMRELTAGEFLSPDDTMAFERAESHLDKRLKTQLSLLFGVQDRRMAREQKASTNLRISGS